MMFYKSFRVVGCNVIHLDRVVGWKAARTRTNSSSSWPCWRTRTMESDFGSGLYILWKIGDRRSPMKNFCVEGIRKELWKV